MLTVLLADFCCYDALTAVAILQYGQMSTNVLEGLALVGEISVACAVLTRLLPGAETVTGGELSFFDVLAFMVSLPFITGWLFETIDTLLLKKRMSQALTFRVSRLLFEWRARSGGPAVYAAAVRLTFSLLSEAFAETAGVKNAAEKVKDDSSKHESSLSTSGSSYSGSNSDAAFDSDSDEDGGITRTTVETPVQTAGSHDTEASGSEASYSDSDVTGSSFTTEFTSSDSESSVNPASVPPAQPQRSWPTSFLLLLMPRWLRASAPSRPRSQPVESSSELQSSTVPSARPSTVSTSSSGDSASSSSGGYSGSRSSGGAGGLPTSVTSTASSNSRNSREHQAGALRSVASVVHGYSGSDGKQLYRLTNDPNSRVISDYSVAENDEEESTEGDSSSDSDTDDSDDGTLRIALGTESAAMLATGGQRASSATEDEGIEGSGSADDDSSGSDQEHDSQESPDEYEDGDDSDVSGDAHDGHASEDVDERVQPTAAGVSPIAPSAAAVARAVALLRLRSDSDGDDGTVVDLDDLR